jgi:hypothetical protein
MKDLIMCIVFLCVMPLVLVICQDEPSLANDYLVGIFGVPKTDWSVLREVGLNAALVREDETSLVRDLQIKKIYALGVNPAEIKKGLNRKELENRLQKFKELKDGYSYYLAGDMNCRRKNLLDSLKKQLNLNQRLIVCLLNSGKDIGCYPDYDVFFYHYPLMRRQVSLSDMLGDQVATLRKAGFNGYLFVQAHQQFWYKDAIKSARADRDSYLYPDGQVVRMLIYYAMATGCKGYFLYDWEAMTGGASQERMLAAAQTILETRALYPALSKAGKVEFFKKGSDVYGTVVETPGHDLVFAFSGDAKTNYHPSIQSVKVELKDLIGSRKYQSVYRYSPLGCTPVGEKLEVPQDHALILIGLKNKQNLDELKMDTGALKTYARLLEARSEKLASNLKLRGLAAPALKQSGSELETRIPALLTYIDQLNELKRDAWWTKAGKMPLDGDVLNDLQWGRSAQQVRPTNGDSFNFYYH